MAFIGGTGGRPAEWGDVNFSPGAVVLGHPCHGGAGGVARQPQHNSTGFAAAIWWRHFPKRWSL